MKKSYFYIFKIKKLLLPFILTLFTICLILFSTSNLSAAKKGLTLWANSIVPSLFPFFVATELLSHTPFTYYLGKLLNRFMKPVFNIRGEGSFAFIMGIISGYPMGAKIAADFRTNNICSKEECERLLSFTNNSGPLFIVGTVGISMFANSTIGFILLITHLLASITVGIVFRFWKYNVNSQVIRNNSYINSKDNITLSNLPDKLVDKVALYIEGDNNTIRYNTISNFSDGIIIEGNNNTILNNTLSNIKNTAISLTAVNNSNYGNILDSNTVKNSNIGISIISSKNSLTRNHIVKNKVFNCSVGITLSNTVSDKTKTTLNIINENIVMRGKGTSTEYTLSNKTIVSEFSSKNIISSNITSGKEIIAPSDVLNNNIY